MTRKEHTGMHYKNGDIMKLTPEIIKLRCDKSRDTRRKNTLHDRLQDGKYKCTVCEIF